MNSKPDIAVQGDKEKSEMGTSRFTEDLKSQKNTVTNAVISKLNKKAT